MVIDIDIKTINHLLSLQTGNESFIYPIIKDKIWLEYNDDEEAVAFAQEFLCFEDKYLSIAKHIKDNKINNEYNTVVDIGCQFGFQSEIFLDFDYIGIDYEKLHFFNTNEKNVKYLVESFPYVSVSLNNCITISSMSIGYFNNEEKGITNETVSAKLVECDCLYISTTPVVLSIIKPYFNIVKKIQTNKVMNYEYGIWYMRK